MGYMIDPSIFKAYDVRAVYPDQLDEKGIYNIGRAFVEFLKVNEVVLGYDMRTSVPALKPHLIAGLNDAGAKVIDIGMTGTEVMYFTVGNFGYPAGIMLTASHNPKKYTGLKLVSKGAAPIGADTGIYDLRDLAVKNQYTRTNSPENMENFDPIPELKKKIKSMVDFTKIKPMKIVVDAGNGIGGQLFKHILGDLPIELIPLYFEPDGTFPNHQANPIKEENTKELRKKVIEEKADLGIALDGDGDRVFFVDENGIFSLGYYLVGILAKNMLKKYPGAKIVYENRLRWAIEDDVLSSGGKLVASPAGHSLIKYAMRKHDAQFAGETSSHFYYKELSYADSSMLTIALLLEILTESGKTLGQVLQPYRQKYFISGELNFKVDDANHTLNKVRNVYKGHGLPIDELDGVAIDNDRQWRFSLRKSNTEPLVRLNVEAKSQELVDKIRQEVEGLITNA